MKPVVKQKLSTLQDIINNAQAGGGGGTVDAYTKAEADAKFETITGAAAAYLSKTDAASTYLSKSDAASTYLSKSDAASTYLSKTDAASKTNKFIFTSNVRNLGGTLVLIYNIPFANYDYDNFVGGAIGILDYTGSPANQIFLLHMPSTPGNGTAYCITNNDLYFLVTYNPENNIKIQIELPTDFLPADTPVNLKIIV